MTETPAGLARWSESARILGLACVPRLGRVPLLYRALAPHNLLTGTTRYVNLGYWKHDPPDLDGAGAALADLVADAAQMSATDRVLDVGFGFADQDLHWVRSGRAAPLLTALKKVAAVPRGARL